MIDPGTVKYTKTIQVDHEGMRLTAHYIRGVDGEWMLSELSGNVEHFSRGIIFALLQACLDEHPLQ